jgi:death on curing protein
VSDAETVRHPALNRLLIQSRLKQGGEEELAAPLVRYSNTHRRFWRERSGVSPKNRRPLSRHPERGRRGARISLRFDGLSGLRDIGSIEAAIARLYCGYYRPIAQKAAALLQSLAMNHGFIDGNKRTAVQMAMLLLARSGYKLRDKYKVRLNSEVEEMVLRVVEHRMTFDELVVWFRTRILPIR